MRDPISPEPGLRPVRADLWLAAGLAAIGAGVSVLAPAEPPYRDFAPTGLAIAVVAALCLIWRQAAPFLVLVATSAMLVVNTVAGYAASFVQWPAWIALFTCFSLYGSPWRRAGGALVSLLSVTGYVAFTREPADPLTLAGILMCFLISTVAGDAARTRRAFAAATEQRLLGEARERAMLAERVLIEERVRLARELHDALGHAVNVMVMQAGVGRRVFADNPAFGHEALGHIEKLGRGALEELDRLLRVLHPSTAGAAPEPAQEDLAELATRVRAAGRDLEIDAGEVHLTPSTSRTLYRIIQEAVTNALRHTTTGRIRLELGQVAGTVLLEVTNEGAGFTTPVPGRGLVNMRERARLEGGDLQAGPCPGGFRVRATLPAVTEPATS